ncbi:carboxylesterase [Alicyclobacillus sp. SO9]|uniref:alpha/beta hydrolase n=1 Tax=Alicyclobacillus sp. SO9 TaxID=2665646 RepID=UPI0018E7BB72|nr:alpha/beta fold hydrolase [Alicyclobacillus sp. SO9]QQE79987.1 alpha/beta fold hydrolase [Alicyclobacillus sp. SO9]
MGKDACILVHGFTGSPEELEPLASVLEKSGYQVLLPVLAGHCGTKEDLKKATAVGWIRGVEETLKEAMHQYEKVHLIGFSAGAMVCAVLAAKYPVESVTMLAPAVYYLGSKQTFREMANLIKATWNSNGFSRDDLKTRMDKMSQVPLKSVQQMRRLVTRGKAALPDISQPVCIIQGRQDEIVEPRGAEYAHATVSSFIKEIHYLENSGHMLCLEGDRNKVQQYVLDFLDSLQVEQQRNSS